MMYGYRYAAAPLYFALIVLLALHVGCSDSNGSGYSADTGSGEDTTQDTAPDVTPDTPPAQDAAPDMQVEPDATEDTSDVPTVDVPPACDPGLARCLNERTLEVLSLIHI